MAGSRAVILLYHRVAALASDPQLLAVHPDRFAAQLAVLRREANVLPLPDLLEAWRAGRLPDRAVSVTFDDGYADGLTTAAPRLTAANVPATVFVTSGYVGGTREFWWDELEQRLLGPGRLPAALTLPVGRRTWRAELGPAVTWHDADVSAHADWQAPQPAPTPRHAAYLALCAALAPLTGADRTVTLDALAAVTGQVGQPSGARPSHRPLTTDQLRALAATAGITIGAHAVSHPSLAQLPVEDQRAEIAGSRAHLAALLGEAPRLFAYPFGSRRDQSWRTRRLTRAAGFDAACANEPGALGRRTHVFRLPRMLVRDWDEATFTLHLREWQRG